MRPADSWTTSKDLSSHTFSFLFCFVLDQVYELFVSASYSDISKIKDSVSVAES